VNGAKVVTVVGSSQDASIQEAAVAATPLTCRRRSSRSYPGVRTACEKYRFTASARRAATPNDMHTSD
jgi:hypothetical protein